MTKALDKRVRALRLMDRVVAEAPDYDTRAMAIALRQRIKLPMFEVLARLEGSNVSAKARDLQIARSTFYAWKKGRTRPRKPEAEALAELTGFTWQEIAARPDNE